MIECNEEQLLVALTPKRIITNSAASLTFLPLFITLVLQHIQCLVESLQSLLNKL